MLKKGIFISIEGIDGSGKSTLAKNLYNYLKNNNFETILTKEPGGTPFGLQLREILQKRTFDINPKSEFLLFASDRAQHFNEVIIPAVQENKIVISDRCHDSSIVYQGYGRGLDIETLKSINAWAMNGMQPDLTIFVRVPVETALERIRERKEELTDFEKEKNFLERAAYGFDELYKDKSNVIILDGRQSPEELLIEAVRTLKNIIICD